MSDAMLRLAKAVYGEAAHVGPQYEWHMDGTVTYRDAVTRVYTEDNGIEPFDPANNADQFCDVLAWLSKNVVCQRFRHGFLELRPLAVVFSIAASGDDSSAVVIDHDGTASGNRAAVVEAALRVVG